MYQELIAVRHEIIEALSLNVRTRGQLEVEASALIKENKRSVAKDEATGAVRFLEPLYAVQSTSYKTGSCPLHFNAFNHAKIARAVNALPDHLNAFALVAYSEQPAWVYTETVSFALWREFIALQSKAFRKKKEKQLKGMVLLAIQDFTHQLTADKPLHKPARIRVLLGVSESNWVRDWLPFWNQLNDVLQGFDEQVLSRVYESTNQATIKREVKAA